MTTMSTIYHLGVERFVRLAEKAGWEWCGVQESIPPGLPVLVIEKQGVTKRIPFDPNEFDPIKTATQYLAPRRKS